MVKQSRTFHSIQNVIWTYIYNFIMTIFPFVIRTLIIKFWGIEYLGINSLFASLLQILNISELGIGQALVSSMYKPIAEGKNEEVNKLLMLYKKFYYILGCIIFVLGMIVFPFVPRFINGNYPQDINLYLAYIIYLLQTCLGYWLFPHCSVAFIADQKSYISNKIRTIVWIVIYFLQIIAICCTREYYSYIILIFLSSAICGVVDGITFNKKYPMYHNIKIKKEDFSDAFWKKFTKKTVSMGFSKVRNVCRTSIDTIFISTFLSVRLVALYQNYSLLMTTVLYLITAFTTGILPSLGNCMSLEKENKNYEIVKTVYFIVNWMATMFASFLFVFYQDFIEIWVGKDNLLSSEIVCLFVLYFYLRNISEVNVLIRNASGLWWEGFWVSFVEVIINIILNYIFVKLMNIEGIVLATVLSLFFVNIPFETYYVYKYCFKKNPFFELLKYMKNLVVGVITIFLIYVFTRSFSILSIGNIVIKGLVCFFISNFCLLIFNRKTKEYTVVKKIFCDIIIKRGN